MGLIMPTNSGHTTRQHLCDNCLIPITGVYCSHCGQKKVSASKHFSTLLKEFFEDILNLDDKILRTIKPLLFRPGFLSLEYFDDRRMRYVSPLKLYFFLSVITFFLVQQSVESNVTPNDFLQLDDDASKNSKPKGVDINLINGKPWHAKTNPINLPIPDTANTLINQKIIRLDAVIKSKDAQKQLIHAGLSAIPTALLLMLPFFALLLKLAYLFNNRLYMEHMIVALHNHAFLLLIILFSIIANQMGVWWGKSIVWLNPWIDTLTNLLLVFLPVYFLVSLKRVYQQGWRKTLFKFLLIGFCYIFILAFGMIMMLTIGLMSL